MIYSRDDLLKQLEGALDLAGANPSRWPQDVRARLSAFVENDQDAARLFAEAKALDRVLSCSCRGMLSSMCETRILSRCIELPQQIGGGSASVLPFRDRRGRQFRASQIQLPGRAFWGGAAVLAASLMLGVYIGASGEAVPTLRNIDAMASNDIDAGILFSGTVFEPSEFGESEPL